jgi:hypothetical protein
MLRALIIATLFLATACATSRQVKFQVESIPSGAQVEGNGMTLCESTPCEITLTCAERWVGYMNSPTGKANASGAYSIEAIPSRSIASERKMYSDRKIIDPCLVPDDQVGRLRFQLELEKVLPTQPVRVKN